MIDGRLPGVPLPVSPIGLGTMMFGAWGNPDRSECRRIADIALDAGITLFDTADIYDRGVGETIVGEVLAGRRDRVVLATKVGNPMSGDPLERGLSQRWIATACNDSLRRLGVEHIDLYQMHRPDPSAPIAESIRAMNDLISAGKIRAYGTSTFSAAQLAEALQVCATDGLVPPATEQPPFSILCRGIEREVAPLCAANNVGLLAWAPLNGGWLTGKYTIDAPADSRARREADHFDFQDEAMRHRKLQLVDQLTSVAAAASLSLLELAVRFVVSQPAVASCLIGPRTPAQAQQLCNIEPTALPADVLHAIDAVVAPGHTVNPRDDG